MMHGRKLTKHHSLSAGRYLPSVVVPLVLMALFCAGLPFGCTSAVKDTEASSSSAEPLLITGNTMGTTYMVKYFPVVKHGNGGRSDKEDLAARIDQELQEVNQQMSTYIPDSELSLFNANRSTDWQMVSDDLAFVLATAQSLSEASEGAFDVTVGPLVKLWGFGANARTQQPTKSEVEAIKETVGFAKLLIKRAEASIRKESEGLQVDLSAIAKGHGVDRVCDVLEEAGVVSYFVEVGGEVRTKGKKQSGDSWVVGVETPDPERRDILFALALDDMALATSGDYRNYRELDGKVISHTINPNTGFPVDDPITSASAFSTTCAEADGIATAMMAAGFEAGLALAEDNQWAVVLIARTESEPGIKLALSSRFKELFPSETLSSDLGVKQ